MRRQRVVHVGDADNLREKRHFVAAEVLADIRCRRDARDGSE